MSLEKPCKINKKLYEEDCIPRKSCGIDDPSGVLCRSYYICHPKPEPLAKEKCLDCGKTVLVPRYGPYCGDVRPTGVWLSFMDEHQNEKTIGVLCHDCADKRYVKGKIGFGSCGTYFRNEMLILDAMVSES